MSEYDPIGWRRRPSPADEEAFERLRLRFQEAASPYLTYPWSWLTWAVLLPAAALATFRLGGELGFAGLLFLWSGTILVGGAVEAGVLLRTLRSTSPIASWALRVQGNLSLVALLLSGLLVWRGEAWALPGVWLLLIGHSFFQLGGLSFPALRRYGVAYQLGGAAALALAAYALPIFAATTATANLGLAWAVWRRRREAAAG